MLFCGIISVFRERATGVYNSERGKEAKSLGEQAESKILYLDGGTEVEQIIRGDVRKLCQAPAPAAFWSTRAALVMPLMMREQERRQKALSRLCKGESARSRHRWALSVSPRSFPYRKKWQ